ncbi:MAG: nitric-oxide reductase large subunit [Deltaproteobacteria bacterium]|nr:MAG: nitric-oxide reductase large subunit [Deltaproteobacteria bacterium]
MALALHRGGASGNSVAVTCEVNSRRRTGRMSTTTLKRVAIASFVIAMAVLLGGGWFASRELPPYPGKTVDESGTVLFTRDDILAGQDVYQKYGLMDHGSVWGHGSQRGPEFSALSLHIVAETVRDIIAGRRFGKPFAALEGFDREVAALEATKTIKKNGYDAGTDTLRLSPALVEAYRKVVDHWSGVFEKGAIEYGIMPEAVPDPDERAKLGTFFFWTAWVASAARPGSEYSYTNNWPPDEAAGNVPTTSTYLWSLGGILALLLVLGFFIWFVHHYKMWYGEEKGVALADKLIDMPLTSSQQKAAKFFLVVILLFLVQTTFGGLLAHYTVHPGSFYIDAVAKAIPYSWAKSWHLQLAVFWIATTWVASAIYLSPIIGGREPKKQGLLVQLLFAAVLVVAVGSLAGEVLGIKGKLGDLWYWFGHQGWEYLELGRIWQILLFVGLIAWLLIVYRAVVNHLKLKHQDEMNSLIYFYVFSAILVVAFFGFGLFYGRGSHLTLADYWRWFVVHIWVESIFEFFGVGVISVLLVAMGLVTAKAALRTAYFTAALVFLSGIIGTAHHYYWYGGPSFWIGIGSVFSSMEPVPLMGLVVRALMEYKAIKAQGREFPYRWPLFFLVASSVWNFIGAGVFGFLINLPIVNYYEHGTYLTMNHGHTALFGTYGMLSIALLLFSWRGLVDRKSWNDRLLRVSFWGLNGGLALMALTTLFPVGIVQAVASFREGLWVARSAEFFEKGIVKFLGQFRIVPDTIIILFGVLPLAWFLFSTYRHLKPRRIEDGESVWEKLGVEL